MKKSIITLTLVLALGVSFFIVPTASAQATRTVKIGVLLADDVDLDKNGDRQIGYYKFYHLIPDEAGYLWENNGIYSQDVLKPGVMERW